MRETGVNHQLQNVFSELKSIIQSKNFSGITSLINKSKIAGLLPLLPRQVAAYFFISPNVDLLIKLLQKISEQPTSHCSAPPLILNPQQLALLRFMSTMQTIAPMQLPGIVEEEYPTPIGTMGDQSAPMLDVFVFPFSLTDIQAKKLQVNQKNKIAQLLNTSDQAAYISQLQDLGVQLSKELISYCKQIIATDPMNNLPLLLQCMRSNEYMNTLSIESLLKLLYTFQSKADADQLYAQQLEFVREALESHLFTLFIWRRSIDVDLSTFFFSSKLTNKWLERISAGCNLTFTKQWYAKVRQVHAENLQVPASVFTEAASNDNFVTTLRWFLEKEHEVPSHWPTLSFDYKLLGRTQPRWLLKKDLCDTLCFSSILVIIGLLGIGIVAHDSKKVSALVIGIVSILFSTLTLGHIVYNRYRNYCDRKQVFLSISRRMDNFTDVINQYSHHFLVNDASQRKILSGIGSNTNSVFSIKARQQLESISSVSALVTAS